MEAPGDLLSGLLGVSAAGTLAVPAGSVRALTVEYGEWCVAAPLSGRLRLSWADRAWALEERQAAVIHGAEALSLLAAEACELGVLILRGTTADAVLECCRREGGLFFENGGLAVERMLRQLSARQPHEVPAKEASEHAYRLLMALYGSASAGPENGKKVPLVVEAALGILHREFAFLDSIAELAERLEVSQEYLTRSFCRYIGITPGKYLTQVRIENAKLLLRQGRHSVQFVSDACGFSNSNYFARVFRSSTGMNPRDYARREGSLPQPRQAQEDALYVL
ncbi:MAG: helix-turn-helix transcriptional regulator [Oscillospiraceae bacterium]|nr:helix-turn-helix transcriptional regulator [Oscillospiraceae bacterium]